jgi:hypothetical protein
MAITNVPPYPGMCVLLAYLHIARARMCMCLCEMLIRSSAVTDITRLRNFEVMYEIYNVYRISNLVISAAKSKIRR